jgi:hypothetical protein
MHSFKGLIITNLIGAGFTLAFSIAYGVPKIIPLLTQRTFDGSQIPYLILIIFGFVVAISWITRSAELMDEHDDIITELENLRTDDDEAIINIIVQSLAFYRDKQTKIKQLGIVSRIVGGFLILTAIPQIQALLTGVYPLGDWMIIGQFFGLIGSLGVGVAGLYVPTLINRFSNKWDTRLSITEVAEERLDRILRE